MMNTKNVLVRGIPEEVHKDLKILAVIKNMTLQDLIIRVLSEYVDKEKGT
jgi:hypothetical protein